MQVIFCDNHLLVVSKPAGLSTQPHLILRGGEISRFPLRQSPGIEIGGGGGSINPIQPPPPPTQSRELSRERKTQNFTASQYSSRDNLTDRAKAWVKKEYKKPGAVFLEPIHRLDRPVSGLVLFARTDKALSRLQEMMRQRQISKTYFAWVEGHLEPASGTLEHYLVHGEHKARVAQPSHSDAKLARLHYKTVEQQKDRCLLEIDLETGRYHQIRVQCATLGHPVIGDAKYGSAHRLKGEGILLHHGRLQLIHPVTKQPLVLKDLQSAAFSL